METKKNPDKDIYRHTSKFFLLGLIISVTLVITAFEWRSEKREMAVRIFDQPMEALLEVKATKHEPTPATPLIKQTSTKAFSSEVVPIHFVESDDPEIGKELDKDETLAPPVDELPIEVIEDILLFPEIKPVPVGGFENFYIYISKNLKYPRTAQRSHIEGKVFIEFVIDKSGSVTQLKIIKGIGSGCDEEAMRVLTQTRWEPGRQRGKPVKVRMTMPVNFVLD
ncbi:MAG: energy transducer TonB [Cyclobacteriaceae bacterium]|jgi:periplasmic protein TonB|nr:energy transducer TonB [Cyclobacteriaceae bacterium]